MDGPIATTATPTTAPAGWAQLDYPGARILLQATSQWERGWRANACAKEPWTVAFLESLVPGQDVLWNVGANVGSYALIAGARGVMTVAIEPGYASYAALCNNVLANHLEAMVAPLCLAIGGRSGLAPLSYRSVEAGAASHAFGTVGAPKSVGTLPTLALTLDELLARVPGLPAPTHLLIDVDGAEPDVLAGGPRLLAERGPAVLIEVQTDTPRETQIHSILRGWGYTLTSRFDRRKGQLMGGCHYELWAREPAT